MSPFVPPLAMTSAASADAGYSAVPVSSAHTPMSSPPAWPASAPALSSSSLPHGTEAAQAGVRMAQSGDVRAVLGRVQALQSSTALESGTVPAVTMQSLQLTLSEGQLNRLLGSVAGHQYQVERLDSHGLLSIAGSADGILALLAHLPEVLSGERQAVVLRDGEGNIVLGRYIYEPETGHLVHTSTHPIGGGASAFALQRLDRLSADRLSQTASSDVLREGRETLAVALKERGESTAVDRLAGSGVANRLEVTEETDDNRPVTVTAKLEESTVPETTVPTVRETGNEPVTQPASELPLIPSGASNADPVLSDMVSSVTFLENTVNAAVQVIDSDVTLFDLDTASYGGGQLVISYGGNGLAEDSLSFDTSGQVGIAGADVSVGGTVIGQITSNGAAGADLTLALNDNATPARLETLLESLTYANNSDTPAGSRVVTIHLADGAGASLDHAVTVTVTAEADDQLLTGTPASDTLTGAQGNDTIVGLASADSLTGGLGADIFRFTSTTDAGTGATKDIIADFSQAQGDKIDLTTLPLAIAVNGTAAFTSPGAHAQLRWSQSATDTLVQLDTDGNGSSDFEILLQGFTATNLTIDDFLLPTAAVTVTGTAGADSLFGGLGADTFTSGDGDDVIYAYAGSDSINSDGRGSELIVAGDGNDYIIDNDPWSYSDTIYGGNDNDTIISGHGADRLYGGDGNDSISAQNSAQTIDGGAGKDTLSGGNHGDIYLFSDLSHSTVSNPDLIIGWEAGTDKIWLRMFGDLGISSITDFEVLSYNGSVTLLHDTDTDFAITFNADVTATLNNASFVFGDIFNGTGASDTIAGTAFNDLIDGGTTGAADSLNGYGGDDYIYDADAHGSADTLLGGDGNDTLISEHGADRLYGEDGNDSLSAGNQNDTLDGGDGADTLIGGANADSLTGGLGADLFRFTATTDAGTGAAKDIIADFSQGQGDKIDLSTLPFAIAVTGTAAFTSPGTHAQLRWSQSATDTLVQLDTDGNGTSDFEILLQGVTATNLTDSDFLLPNIGITYTAGNGNEAINGSGGNDNITDGTGNDTINGGAGNDTINAGNGNDVINGGDGNDVIIDSGGVDTIDGGAGDDSITTGYYGIARGGDGADTINADNGHQTLYGDDGDDRISGGGGNDTLYGGNGSDVFVFHYISHGATSLIKDFVAGEDKLEMPFFDGIGSGADQMTVSYNGGTNRTTLTHNSLGTALVLEGNITLTDGDFIVRAANNGTDNAEAVTIALQSGNYYAGAGSDTITSTQAGTTLYAGYGDDLANVSGYIASYMGEGNDTVNGSVGNDGMYGQRGDDSLAGNLGTDNLSGGDGNDIFSFFLPSYSGGSAIDTVLDFVVGEDKLEIPFYNGIGAGSDQMTLTYNGGTNKTTLEQVEIGFKLVLNGNITLTDSDFIIRAPINGTSGNDSITVSTANGIAYAGDGNDTIIATQSSITIFAGSGNDSINVGAYGAAYAGAGDDIVTVTASYSSQSLFGQSGNDRLSGQGVNGGSDNINGGSGNDTLDGGGGKDTLTGGTESDTFVFTNLTHSTNAAPDLITDFQNGSDRIQLTSLGFTALSDFETLSYNGTITTLADTQTSFTITFTGDVTGLLDNTDFIW